MCDFHSQPNSFRQITPSATPLVPQPHRIVVGTTGTIAIENADGSTAIGVPVVAGQTIDCRIYKLTAASGAIYGCFHDIPQ